MKPFASTHSHTQKNVPVIEHTPIYDLVAYHKRQRQIKRKQILKNLIDTTVFFSTVIFTFSILFWEV